MEAIHSWQGDWETHSCHSSDLLQVFIRRVLTFYDIEDSARGDRIVVTFIDRVGTRNLVDQDQHLLEIKARLKNVELRVIDPGTLPFREQIRVIRESDVLIGVHGAGLTHSFWLRPGSALVEILPETLNHKGFRNIAGLLGQVYFSTHAVSRPSNRRKRDDWHTEAVYIEKDRFVELVWLAVKSVHNHDDRSWDAN